ncbi:MAG: GTP cyclohydrolase I FolE [Candidatus Omnitrophica bacterium]|nr:GTP cyclohydrolase I FolE [bacterium]MBV6483045.1 GTP cyclohydrolase 1 [bacterium]MBW7938348.1 GTP cyclohydrolase I FolE [Candidatus Omnitrophota bacterium]MCE7906885.1 GTP cyclohydrolase I FolE [Candidatus Omnitrophica bacterium COP1]
MSADCPHNDDLDSVAAQGNHLIDLPRIERAVREIFLALGEDPDREGIRKTPERVARMYAEVFEGLYQDPDEVFKTSFEEKYNEMVLLKDIPMHSMCEHHLLPFTGLAHVAYIPNGRVAGLSKLARVVDLFARRPQVQERLTEQIADFIQSRLDTKGVAVVIEATHSCMAIRGVKKPGARMVTSAMRGFFLADHRSRHEVLSLIYGSANSYF